MIHRHGFSLVELLVALALSSIIMLGLVHANRNAARLLHEAEYLLVVNRGVSVLLTQLEHDVSATIPYQKPVSYAPMQAKPKEGEQKTETTQETPPPKPDEKKKEDQFVPSVMLEPFEDATFRALDRKWQQTKRFSMVTTTVLEVYDEPMERVVRVCYELVLEKKLSSPDRSVYTLYRVQTPATANIKGESKKDEDPKKAPPLQRYVVAERVKHFSLEAAYAKRPPQKDQKQAAGSTADASPEEPAKTFVWGEKEEKEKSKYMAPEQYALYLEVWDTPLKRSYSFTTVLPVFARIEAAPPAKPEAPGAQKDEQGAGEKKPEAGDKKPETGEEIQPPAVAEGAHA